MSNFISIKWGRFLTEGEAEQFPWLKDIKVSDEGVDWDWDNFILAGQGSFRKTLVPRDDEDYVVKIVHDLDRDKLQMNKDDFDTAKRYPFIFPKAYAHADDFSWIVMDWTSPIVWPSQMQRVLDKSFPKEQEALLKVADELKFNPADPFHIMKMIMASFRADRPINEVESKATAEARAQLLQQVLPPVAGPAYQELSKAMHEFEIDRLELGKGNIGHDEDHNFKIIDSSVFSSDPEKGARE